MSQLLDDEKPIFQQIRETIEDAILDSTLLPEDKIPSINDFAKQFQINPATANKGVNELVEKGVIYKKRGVGMYVSSNAKQILVSERKNAFEQSYVTPLINEASRLGITLDELKEMIGRAKT